MQRVKFFLLTALILLSGAALSGLAARKVVAPPAGEVVSAGEVSIPSVLGQTADEVLFYPWTVYDMQTLTPISEDELSIYGPDNLFTAVAAIKALGADFDMEQLVRAQQVSEGRHLAAANNEARYVKDFPARLGDVPVLLSYAQSGYNPTAVSWLMRPAQEAAISEEQQREALDKVQNDLAGLIWYNVMAPERNYSNDLTIFLREFDVLRDEALLFYGWLSEWMQLMYFQYTGGYGELAEEQQGAGVTIYPDGQEAWQGEPPPYTLEELLAMGQGGFVDIQFISTHRQIVLLFYQNSDTKMGVYYDIQLGRYSGLGMSS